MSGDMYKRLKLGPLDTKRLPKVVGADGTSLGAMGRISCEINIGERTFKQTFLVCQNITRPVILGKDFARDNCAGVHWTENNTRMLKINLEKITETPELIPTKTKYTISLKKAENLPPRSCAVVDMNINTDSKEKVQMIPDELCQFNNPNMCMYSLHADLEEKRKDTMTPYMIINLSSTEHLYRPKKHVVAFAEKDDTDGEVFEIDNLDTTPKNWVAERTWRTFAQFAPNEAETDLHKVLTTATNFIKSPADVETHRKVDLKDAQIKEETKGKFHDLCNQFDSIISKSSGDIGKTLLIEMDIDTGNSPPIASRPYTLPLKHYEWVRKEISTLERAGIITKSILPWASPMVNVRKKSAPGEPPQRRMCVDFRKLNKTQPEVHNMNGGKGCISLVPLPKIDELYAKLQGYKIHHDLKIELPISNLKLKELQEQDRKINHLRKLWSKNKLKKNIFAMENDILKKKVIECGLLYKPVIIPEILRECLLILAHDEQGHNGFKRTHSALKTLYYWKGMKRHIQLYCRRCRTCARHNVQTQELQKEHFSAPPGFSPFFLMYGHEENAKHMILAKETTKYLGDNEGVLNVQLMTKLLQVVAYNLAKSRTAQDGNRLKRKNFRPRHIKINHPVLVRNHTAKPFEARSNDYICMGFEGNNRILVKDNHGKITKVNRKDVTPIEMDIKIAELFKESRQNSKIRDAQLAMPTSRIPDLDWKFDEDIQLIEPVHEQVYSLEQTQEKEQPITPSPVAAPMEKETQPVQPAEEVTTEAIVLEAVQTPKIEECQKTPQTPIVSRFLSVLKPVAAAVT